MGVTVRVAAAQFAVGTDRRANLAACLRAIGAAARRGACLVVLPEFCNHLSWYDDRAHALRMACRPGDDFLAPVATAAERHGMFVKLHVTLATADEDRDRVTAASLLYGPDGTLVAHADKQVLMGSENDHLDPALEAGPVVDTALGRIGLYACMEGVISEVCRGLALRGAQVLLNSLNSFALDEASLHIPVRAAENRVWVVAANKVGPLLPDAHADAVAAGLGVPREALHGAGESQIVAPDGTVVARAPRTGEGVVVADIEPARADDKRRPDGTDVFDARRPELYVPIAAQPRPAPDFPGRRADEVTAAVVRPGATEPRDAVAEAAQLTTRAVARGASLVVVPELFCFPGGVVEAAPGDQLVKEALAALTGALAGTDAYLACTLPHEGVHTGYVLRADGPVLVQPQLHRSARHAAWADGPSGSRLLTYDTPWGRVAVVVGDDSLYPETFRLAALAGVDTAAVCFTGTESWESRLGLPERSAENRLNVVAAGHTTGAVHCLPRDFGLWQTRDAPFDGRISHPDTTPADSRLALGPIRPAQAARRLVSRGTDLVDGRPWHLAGPLISAARPGGAA
ncbi:nitrilase-related carbon-nitrogen hydrolase [Streptomyces sp. CB03238]|uniref:nitrilase-related carbon-nitrogen hydrolase n=1 Tax=Streptomyces sp. CB03238 TaxID=1907777 RepID=UPI000A10E1D4|nr:nitrilase-related carbon-nitrogen hydrolase [Streptomyces sp. CB03238]ORT56353.1 carbon-nitrogen hydrolase [Streptomyces sp. CB03238]